MASKIVCDAVEGQGAVLHFGRVPRTARPAPKAPRQRTYMREWRKQHASLTLEQAVERLLELTGYQIDHSQLSRVERGTSPYSQDLLEALAIVYRAEPADLIRRLPGSPTGIQLEGLAPDQVRLVENMVEQLKRTGTGT